MRPVAKDRKIVLSAIHNRRHLLTRTSRLLFIKHTSAFIPYYSYQQTVAYK